MNRTQKVEVFWDLMILIMLGLAMTGTFHLLTFWPWFRTSLGVCIVISSSMILGFAMIWAIAHRLERE